MSKQGEVEVQVHVSGIHGSSAVCSCGWAGQRRRGYREAQDDARRHARAKGCVTVGIPPLTLDSAVPNQATTEETGANE